MMTAKVTKVNGVPTLQVSCPLSEAPSKTGKTTVVASSRGNKATAAQHKGHPIIVGLNAYIQVPSTPAATE